MPNVLIVDDEKNIRATLARSLRLEGYTTTEAQDGAEALRKLDEEEIDLISLDLQMPVMDGMEVLEALDRRPARVPVLVLTAHGTIDRAVRAVRLGAFDFIEKPPAAERILVAAENALRVGSLERENRHLAEEAGLGTELLGESPPMKTLVRTVLRVAPTDAAVLLLGENGTGKELVARAIREASRRKRRPFVTVNCAAIPDTLFESELFGHARGAFTGATEARRGKFQRADGGTLFLDEVGEIPLPLQPKLLRALETGEVERVGGQGSERADVRVIAATNRDLELEVRGGRFRQDLYYRLLVVPVRVPPLRERIDDIPILARHFLEAACRRNRAKPKRLADSALAALARHDWPGNVRELRNAMERVSILVGDDVLEASHLGFLREASASARPTEGPVDLTEELRRYERDLVLRVLERNGWQMSATARELGLERSHLYKKLKALGIERPAP